MKVVVIIPIYRPNIEKFEKASLRQGLSILRRYPISFVTPENMDVSEYISICGRFPDLKITFEYFAPMWFDGVTGYNHLCLSQILYKRFAKFDYMLIYQLDAWVFEDSLMKWCNKGYDYIGAPWIEKDENGKEQFLVGNGGLSLRRIQYFINLLSSSNRILLCSQWIKRCKSMKDCFLLFPHILGYHADGALFLSRLADEINEDIIISKLLWNTNFPPQLPNYEDAIGFAIECEPSRMYEINGNKLPFGCHAFEKWEYKTFWNNFIKIENV